MNNNNYELQVGVRVNAGTQAQKELQSELDKLSKKSVITTEINFNGKNAIKDIETYVDKVKNKLYTVERIYESISKYTDIGIFTEKGAELQDYVTKVKDYQQSLESVKITQQSITKAGTLSTVIKEEKDGLAQTTTYIDKYKDSLGRLVEETKVFNEVTKKWGETQKNISQDMSITEKSFKRYKDSQGKVISETKELNSQQDGYITRITEEIGKDNELIKTIEKIKVSRGQELSAQKEVTTEITNDTLKREESIEAMKKQSLQNVRLNSTFSDFISTMGKVLKFQIITKIITGFTSAVRESVTIVKDFDSALTEFKKVSDLSGESLDSYTRKLGELGETVARTRKHLCECV